jgi:nicotinate-nucleotide pyrophosphorylase (carboxylating)
MSTFSAAETAACNALIQLALAEDLGTAGDLTAQATIPAATQARSAFVPRKSGVIAGLPAVQLVARAVDPGLRFKALVADGSPVQAGTALATLEGSLRSILAAERTALNFVQHLSGIASLTRQYVDAVRDTTAKILDTRKTLPGWRLLEKYAVRMGGGVNHRMGLYDGILIKDNHLHGLGGDLRQAVELARSQAFSRQLPVEVEVETLEQLEVALAVPADIVLLDNMTCDQLRLAVQRRNIVAPNVLLEASGGVNLTTVQSIAATGVDRISIGALTHSAPALDIALDYLR